MMGFLLFIIGLFGLFVSSAQAQTIGNQTAKIYVDEIEQLYFVSGNFHLPNAIENIQPIASFVEKEIKLTFSKKKILYLLNNCKGNTSYLLETGNNTEKFLKFNHHNLFLYYHSSLSLWQSFLL